MLGHQLAAVQEPQRVGATLDLEDLADERERHGSWTCPGLVDTYPLREEGGPSVGKDDGEVVTVSLHWLPGP